MKKVLFAMALVIMVFGCETYQRDMERNEKMRSYAQEMKQKRIASENARDEQRRIEAEKFNAAKGGDKKLSVVDHLLWHDSMGTPVITFSLYNNTDKDINAIEMSFACYDNFNRQVRRYGKGSATFSGLSQDHIKANSRGSAIFSLFGQESTTNIKNIKITRINYVK